MFLTLALVLVACQGWSADDPNAYRATSTPDPLHYPVMKPTEELITESRSLTTGNGIRCDVNNDGKCDAVDSLIVFTDRQATARAPKPTTTPRATAAPRATATSRPTASATVQTSATPAPTPTGVPSATAISAATSTTAPASTATASPVPTTPSTGSVITWPVTPFNFGDTPERFNIVFGAVKAATAKRPDLPECNENDATIHPPTKWHSLVYFTIAGDIINPVCHYSHQHGIDPNSGNAIFGEVGAFLGVPGQSVSGPHQTFYVPANINDIGITPAQLAAQGVPVQMENDVKHTGYKWYVSTGSTCSATDRNSEFYQRMCIVAFRVQFHAHSLADFHVRRHSFTFEGKVCADPFNEATCGIRRLAGWAEHNRLFTPPQDVRCWGEFQKSPPPGLIDLPSDEQFSPSPFIVDTPPRDEFRCHWNLNAATVVNNLNGLRAVPEHMPFEWWIQTGGDTRLQIMSPNPIAGVDSNGVALKPYCQQVADTNPHLTNTCRWTGQKLHINTGYIMAVRAYNTYYFLNGKTINAADDVSGDGILDAKRWTNRFGEFRTDTVCNGNPPSLDCLPDTWEGSMHTPHPLRRNADGTPYIDQTTGKRVTLPSGYLQGVKDFRPANQDTTVNVFDGDITPPGVRSWIAEAWQPMSRTFGPPLPDVQELVEHAHGN